MSIVTNPTTFTIVDLNVTPENVTNFFVDMGTASGQYTVHNEVTVSSLTFDASKNSYTGTFASLTNKPNTSGQWYIAGRAVNAVGTSSESPESSFMILLAPSAPTGFSVA
jgi:hypothetical protein